jgi:hypothetical protein
VMFRNAYYDGYRERDDSPFSAVFSRISQVLMRVIETRAIAKRAGTFYMPALLASPAAWWVSAHLPLFPIAFAALLCRGRHGGFISINRSSDRAELAN